jgi:glycine betaine/proline transport system substrate-binding protein
MVTKAGAVALVAILVAACSGSAASPSASESRAASGGMGTKPPVAECGTVKIAQNAWSGYYANVAVVSYILKNELGCDVQVKDIDEQTAWQGFASDEIDVILENWGHEDLAQQYITDQKVAVDLGPTGNQGIIGWYIPKAYADAHPELMEAYKDKATFTQVLNGLKADFVTSESKGKGQVLDGAESYVTMDGDIIRNLGLDFTVVYSGSEATSNAAMKSAIQNNKALLAYWWSPNAFAKEIDFVHLPLPPYEAGCDADTSNITCTDYPPYALNKVASAKFMASGSPAATLLKNFQWTNDDQDTVAYDIAVKGMSYDDAAKAWLDANEATWKAWMAGIPGY